MKVEIHNAIAKITVSQNGEVVSRGTGFLVAPDVLLTALHVIGDRMVDPPVAYPGEVLVEFPGHKTTATVSRMDRDLDWAVLTCAEFPAVRPLPLQEIGNPGDAWQGYGWPEAQALDGMAVHGTVTNQNATLGGQPAIQLYCAEGAAGRGMKLAGLSGGPILSDGAVVGLARFALMNEQRVEAGTFYATSIAQVAGTLGLPVQARHRVAREDANLEILLGRVKQFWIDGVLNRVIDADHLIELPMQERPNLVVQPWAEVGAGVPAEPRDLPVGSSVGALFQEYQCSLLLMGEAGSGKTTALLHLAQDLIDRAERDAAHPVPVVLPLSTWNAKIGTLHAWMIKELSSKYQIPVRVSKPWLNSNQLVVLLDGLDEVAPEQRAACVNGINKFREEYGTTGIAVTCRPSEVEALPELLSLQGAVELQPLSATQIDAVMEQGGESSARLVDALQHDDVLRELAGSPMMLHVMRGVYQGTSDVDLAGEGDAEARRRFLLDAFIDRMFQTGEKANTGFSREQTTSWMSNIADGLVTRSRTLFLIEELEPDWLPNRWGYMGIFSIVFGAILASIISFASLVPTPAGDGGTDGCLGWFVICPLWVFFTGVYDLLRPGERSVAFKVLIYTLLWLPLALPMAVVVSKLYPDSNELLINLAISCPVIALFMAAQNGSGSSLVLTIRTRESQGVSWHKMIIGASVGLLAGAGIGFLNSMKQGEVEKLFDWQPIVSTIGFATGGLLVGALIAGIVPRVVKGKTVPNQGMILSLRLALRVSAFAVVLAAIVPVCALLGSIGSRDSILLTTGIVLVVSFFVLGLAFGGIDALKHYLLRLVIHLTGNGPLNYAKLLDQACRLHFMQRAGSGYLFANRLLLDRFAARNDT